MVRNYEDVLRAWVKEYHACGDFPDEIKILFDGYSETEEGEDDESARETCYAVFVHRRSAEEGFVFPEHETLRGLVVHRPSEETSFSVWVNAQDEVTDISELDEPKDYEWVGDVILAVQRRYDGTDEES